MTNLLVQNVLAFWLEAGPAAWYRKDDDFDRAIRDRFGPLHGQAADGELDGWSVDPDGALALVILLDQFSRNLFRDHPLAFATDPQALAIARSAIANKFDLAVDSRLRAFLYMPFMHAESLADQERCVALTRPLPATFPYALEHRDIIRRFGRFPHRNDVLGRFSSEAERAFLAAGGFAG